MKKNPKRLMKPFVTQIKGMYYASFNEMPMIIGEGETAAEARDDLSDKISAILGAVSDASVRLDHRELHESLQELQRSKENNNDE